MTHPERSESYSRLPYFAHLSPESISALQDNRFTVEQIDLHEGSFEMKVPILSWPSMHEDALALAEMLGESPLAHLGVLTDEAFRKLLFSPLLKNEVGEGTASEMWQAITQRLIGTPFESVKLNVLTQALKGPLQEFYERPGSVFSNGNLSQTANDSAVPISDHQQWVVANLRLNAQELPMFQKRIIRFVSIFHDWGKTVLARNSQHPEIGAAMARTVLLILHQDNPTLYPLSFVEQVCWSISIHHIIERTFQPFKDIEMSLISENIAANTTTLDEMSVVDSIEEIQRWYLAQSGDIQFENPVATISSRQTVDLLNYLQTVAGNQLALLEAEQLTNDLHKEQHQLTIRHRLRATQRILAELFTLLRYPDAEKVKTLIGLIQLIEADLVATDRSNDEVTFRLNQLRLILQGLLATAKTY